MPSIAQQDYIIIEGYANSVSQYFLTSAKTFLDILSYKERPMSALAVLLKVYLYNAESGTFETKPAYYKVTSVESNGTMQVGSNSLSCPFTKEQIEALAAIQEAANYYRQLPPLRADSPTHYLRFSASGTTTYVTVGGKYVIVSGITDNEEIESVEVSSVDATGVACAEITEEDMQKLVGLPRII